MLSRLARQSGIQRVLDTGRAVADLVFPRTCAACRLPLGPASEPVCDPCAADLAVCVGGTYCRACGTDVGPYLLRDERCNACRRHRTPLRRLCRIGRYRGALRDLVLAFKHERTLDGYLGSLLAEAVASGLAPEPDRVFVPIPSPWLRRWQRGFQPTELLAREAAHRLGARWRPLLEMARSVRPQTGLSASEREMNIRGAFRLRPGADVAGETFCLIDDVCTTGATLREAAGVLKRAGAAMIDGAVVARTPLS